MATAVTPPPGRGGTLPLPTATTKLSQQLQAHNSLFDIDLMLQEMIALTTKMTDTLFGEDDRTRKKLKISYQDHIRALTAAHSKMEASFKLHQEKLRQHPTGKEEGFRGCSTGSSLGSSSSTKEV
ncbi:hypothetical protein IV203_018515 [Nitzschia inconspicua]|uniref:Uncharacterized protein n=1 Tax=Nitzschia inconspicua TaxID=303405 RepID=A0A9K3Q5M9_9STRA|nr:hypothetical protein IV203_018515 [Nitzschia inconspicua]